MILAGLGFSTKMQHQQTRCTIILTSLHSATLCCGPGGGGAYLFQAHLRGGLIETGGLFEREGLFNLEKTMVSYLHKELEYKAEKYKKYKKVVGHTAEDENQF